MYTTKDTVKYLPDKMHCKTEKIKKQNRRKKKNININNTYINVLDVRSLLKTINECQENSPRPPQTKQCRCCGAHGKARGAWHTHRHSNP